MAPLLLGSVRVAERVDRVERAGGFDELASSSTRLRFRLDDGGSGRVGSWRGGVPETLFDMSRQVTREGEDGSSLRSSSSKLLARVNWRNRKVD